MNDTTPWQPRDRKPPGYGEQTCAECGAPFTPTSGRQRYCQFHRGSKFATRRNTEARREQRHSEPCWRPPTRLKATGVHHLKQRQKSVDQALKLARRLDRVGHESCAFVVVVLAERTAGGEVALVGCHDLMSFVDYIDFDHFGPHVPQGRMEEIGPQCREALRIVKVSNAVVTGLIGQWGTLHDIPETLEEAVLADLERGWPESDYDPELVARARRLVSDPHLVMSPIAPAALGPTGSNADNPTSR